MTRIDKNQRNQDARYVSSSSVKGMSDIAYEYSEKGKDPGGYGVGAALLLRADRSRRSAGHTTETTLPDSYPVYAGFNINISGFQQKVHAEQLAIQQAMLDIAMYGVEDIVDVRQMVVRTTEDDHALCCGHCLQHLRAFCNYLDQDADDVSYVSAALEHEDDDGTHRCFDYETFSVGELLPETYCEL